jgi:hypothetical protein
LSDVKIIITKLIYRFLRLSIDIYFDDNYVVCVDL